MSTHPPVPTPATTPDSDDPAAGALAAIRSVVPQSLAAWRKQRTLSQHELMVLVHEQSSDPKKLTVQTVKAVETGRVIPSLPTAPALARALRVRVEAVAWPTAAQTKDQTTSRTNRYARAQDKKKAAQTAQEQQEQQEQQQEAVASATQTAQRRPRRTKTP